MKTFGLKEKKIFVTGVDGFLGQHLRRALVEEGAYVIGSDVKQSNTAHELNISSPENVQDYVEIQSILGSKFDGLINNAALNVKARDIAEADFDRTLKVNLFGTNNMITKLEPLLDNGASIVNISSIYASRSPDFNIYDGNEELYSNISYGISKAGIEQMTRYYARLYGPRIRVNAIAPGGIYQGHSDDFVSKYARMVPLQRMANVEEIVNSILFLLSPLSSYINGHVLKVDGGLNA